MRQICERSDEVERNSENIELWLKLKAADGVGSVTFARLMEQFGTIDDVMGASVAKMVKVEGIGEQTAQKIARTREAFDAERELELAEKLGVWLVTTEDERYPAALKSIYDPPPVLYVRGTLVRGDALAVAMVGSRRCSLYGQEQASRFAHFLASAGFTVVSGGARGIDSAAHTGALKAGGRTIAVQGCGLKNVFPPENDKLFAQIAENGAVISELPLETESLASYFPPRNRIIAGLSMGVIVVEAAQASGSLITATASLDYSREVMAIPGKIDSPLSKGCNELIKKGARLVDCVEDVMDALGYVGQGLSEHAGAAARAAEEEVEGGLFDAAKLKLVGHEEQVFGSLTKEPQHIDEVIAATGLGAGAVSAALVGLQLKGLVKQLPGGLYVRR
jgi:DNA processing protein